MTFVNSASAVFTPRFALFDTRPEDVLEACRVRGSRSIKAGLCPLDARDVGLPTLAVVRGALSGTGSSVTFLPLNRRMLSLNVSMSSLL